MLVNNTRPIRVMGGVKMKGFKLVALFAIIATFTACSGSGDRKGSLFGSEEAQPVSEIENRGIPENVPLSEPDRGDTVEVIQQETAQEINAATTSQEETLSDSESLATSEALADVPAKEFEPVVFFEYDQFNVSDEGLETVKHFATLLTESETLKLTINGHTDERGSPEYNLALAEKRANSTQEAFVLFGVAKSRIEVISLGEEQPLIDDHTEAAYAKNRRAEFNIYE